MATLMAVPFSRFSNFSQQRKARLARLAREFQIFHDFEIRFSLVLSLSLFLFLSPSLTKAHRRRWRTVEMGQRWKLRQSIKIISRSSYMVEVH